jgi:hypothetical protein
MATEKQIEANRRNAQKSSGPRTGAGKQASSRNSFKLGIHISDVALYDDPESAVDLERTYHEYFDSLQPINALERDCLEELATCKVQLRRLGRIGNGLLNDARERAFGETCSPDTNGKPVSRFDRSQYPPEEQRFVANLHLAAGWVKVHDSLETISRQESRLATRYRHAQNAWLQLVQSRQLLDDSVADSHPAADTHPAAADTHPAADTPGGAGPRPAEASQADPVGNEPASAPVPQPILKNEPNFAQPPVVATKPSASAPAPKPAQPDKPAHNPSDKEIA